jgi:hypothetical protein
MSEKNGESRLDRVEAMMEGLVDAHIRNRLRRSS